MKLLVENPSYIGLVDYHQKQNKMKAKIASQTFSTMHATADGVYFVLTLEKPDQPTKVIAEINPAEIKLKVENSSPILKRISPFVEEMFGYVLEKGDLYVVIRVRPIGLVSQNIQAAYPDSGQSQVFGYSGYLNTGHDITLSFPHGTESGPQIETIWPLGEKE